MKKRALFIVEPQVDFFPGGNLQVPFGDRILPVINKLIENEKFDIIIVSRSWYPDDHKSFVIKLWPSHCVQNTIGSEFHPTLKLDKIPVFTKKNTDECFSSSFNAVNEKLGTVEKYFTENKIDEVYVAGLIGDYNLKETALDCSVFFETFFIVDATKFVDKMNPVLEDLVKNGVMVINSNDVDIFLSDNTL